eukprot:scaffold64677_cov30-Tisochrysis_lutea.AAC.4
MLETTAIKRRESSRRSGRLIILYSITYYIHSVRAWVGVGVGGKDGAGLARLAPPIGRAASASARAAAAAGGRGVLEKDARDLTGAPPCARPSPLSLPPSVFSFLSPPHPLSFRTPPRLSGGMAVRGSQWSGRGRGWLGRNWVEGRAVHDVICLRCGFGGAS